MKFDWQHHGWNNPEPSPVGRVVDLDTGKPISNENRACCFFDDETGEYRYYVKKDGKWLDGTDGKLQVEIGHGRLKFFPWRGSPEEFEAFLANYLKQHEGV